MALIRDFEIPNTGFIVFNAYHLISAIKQEKRLADIPLPVDSTRPDGFTQDPGREEVDYKAGYVASIALDVYTSQEAREQGKYPVGAVSSSPTEVRFNGHVTQIGPSELMFLIDMQSDLSITDQAYNHLKANDYYSTAFDS